MKRQPVNLSESLCHRLNSYALAASAASVGVLALTPPAEAKIVYTKTHRLIETHHTSLKLRFDGSTDFSSRLRQFTTGSDLSIYGCSGSSICTANSVLLSGTLSAAALPPGFRVGAKGKWKREAVLLGWAGVGDGFTTITYVGKWRDVRDRYLGLQFLIGSKTHYGWARLNASITKKYGVRATLTGYAYETIPNKPIITGKTKGPDVTIVQEGSVGHLARGAAQQ